MNSRAFVMAAVGILAVGAWLFVNRANVNAQTRGTQPDDVTKAIAGSKSTDSKMALEMKRLLTQKENIRGRVVGIMQYSDGTCVAIMEGMQRHFTVRARDTQGDAMWKLTLQAYEKGTSIVVALDPARPNESEAKVIVLAPGI